MPQPPAYIRSSNLTQFATANPAAPYPPASVDLEFNNIVATLAQTLANLALLQRDDGVLRNGSVIAESFGPTALQLIGSAGFSVANPVEWTTARAFPARQIVTQGGATYVSVSAHTSGVFATDLAAGRWALLYSTVAVTATAVTFAPTGTIAAGNVQAAIAEAASEAVQKTANLSDIGSASIALNNLLAGTARRISADFSNSTQANRALFQSSTTNGQTAIGVLPNGTATTSALLLYGTSDPANGPMGALLNDAFGVTVSAGAVGTGVQPVLRFVTNALERMRVDVNGNVSLGGAANAVNSARQFIVTNSDAGVSACAQLVTSSEVGSFLFQAGSIAGGRLAYINAGSGFTGGLMLDTTGSVPLVLRTNNTERARWAGDGTFSAQVAGSGMYPAYFCRAWVNFDGTSGSIGSGRANGNVSSVTDNGVGDYTINFATAIPDNYSSVISTGQAGNATGCDIGNAAATAPTTTALRIGTRNSSTGANLDCTYVSVAIFR